MTTGKLLIDSFGQSNQYHIASGANVTGIQAALWCLASVTAVGTVHARIGAACSTACLKLLSCSTCREQISYGSNLPE